VRVSINTQLLRIGLVILVDQEHGTKIGHIEWCYSLTLCDSSRLHYYDFHCRQRKNAALIIIVCVEHDMKTNRVILPSAS
jgi:hypothetical protein